MNNYQQELPNYYPAAMTEALMQENRILKRFLLAAAVVGTIVWVLASRDACAQGFDDPRVADYAALVSGMQHTQQQILERRARLCGSGLTDYCKPMPFVPQMSVEEFRARLPK